MCFCPTFNVAYSDKNNLARESPLDPIFIVTVQVSFPSMEVIDAHGCDTVIVSLH